MKIQERIILMIRSKKYNAYEIMRILSIDKKTLRLILYKETGVYLK